MDFCAAAGCAKQHHPIKSIRRMTNNLEIRKVLEIIIAYYWEIKENSGKLEKNRSVIK
jgi:hypothetical protein